MQTELLAIQNLGKASGPIRRVGRPRRLAFTFWNPLLCAALLWPPLVQAGPSLARKIKVTVTPLAYEESSQTYDSIVTLRNRSGSPLNRPLQLLVVQNGKPSSLSDFPKNVPG